MCARRLEGGTCEGVFREVMYMVSRLKPVEYVSKVTRSRRKRERIRFMGAYTTAMETYNTK
jgi:hypothetical protein